MKGLPVRQGIGGLFRVMGLLDTLLGSIRGEDKQSALAKFVGDLVTNHSSGQGLAGLVQQFQQKGMGDLVNSWVSTGQNKEISAEQVEQALGPGQVQQFAQQTGMQGSQAAGSLAQLLPQIIDKLTPNGQVPAQSDVQSMLGNLLRGFGK
jgi:uncharacterized protein YidB (DUF937 family)